MKSIINGNRKGTCYLCKRMVKTEEHHIFGGPNRKLSERYGLKVYLCPFCHRDNREGAHANLEKMGRLHRIGQLAFEKKHTRAEFMKIFGKNYLEDMENAADEEPEVRLNTRPSGILKGQQEPLPGFLWMEADEREK